MGKIFHDDDGARTGIHQLMLHFPGGVHGIGIDHDKTGPERTEQRYRVLQYIGHDQGDAVAFFKALFLQPGGKVARLKLQLGIGQPGVEVDEGCPVFVSGAALLQNFDNGTVFSQINFSLDAVGITI